ncbi:MAG: phosphatidate cytidylyltransferase [Thermodesulfobacteria bacterium]|nr:phosphatidate cytidylyltransferase [Thermodesulfobacteriota bacterium]
MHRARVLTALVLLPLLIGLVLYGPKILVWLLVLSATEIGWYEYARMTRLPPDLFMAGVFGLFAVLLALYLNPSFFLLALWLSLFLLTLYFLARFAGYEFIVLFGFSLAGMVYLGLCFGHLFLVFTLEQGRLWLLVLLAVVFGTDTGAYYTGRALGRRPFAPRVSPKKTWEGTVGGTLCGMMLGALLVFWLDLAPLPKILPFLGAVSVVGQIGDLLESMIKRACGVKDSGELLPGHGGLLDRVDALIFAAPLFYWGLYFFKF